MIAAGTAGLQGQAGRTLTLDLDPHEIIIVYCQCGKIVEYAGELLQRLHRLPSDTLVYDLQFRLRCRQCNSRSGFRAGIFDGRARGDKRLPRRERVIVPGGP